MTHPRRLQSWGAAVLGCLGLALVAPAVAAEVRVSAATAWVDNVSRTSHLPSQKSARVDEVAAMLGTSRQLAHDWLLFADGLATLQRVENFAALDHGGIAGTLTLRRKFGLGPYAPRLELAGTLSGRVFRESGRSGWQPDLTLRFAQRLAGGWQGAAGAGWTHFVAQAKPYDVQTRRLFAETSYAVNDRWQVGAGASRQWGEFTANAAGAIWAQAIGGGLGPVIFNHYNTLAWAVTDSYGPGWVAYRIRDSRADAWWAEVAPALSDRTTLALRYGAVRVVNAIGIKYDTTAWTVRLAHRF
jgi:hypothetical protein